jgi:hypothetical protein
LVSPSISFPNLTIFLSSIFFKVNTQVFAQLGAMANAYTVGIPITIFTALAGTVVTSFIALIDALREVAIYFIIFTALAAFTGLVLEIIFIQDSSQGFIKCVGAGFFLTIFIIIILLLFAFRLKSLDGEEAGGEGGEEDKDSDLEALKL